MNQNTCHLHCEACHKNSKNHTLNIKTFITQNTPGSENEQTVPRWAQEGSTQTDLALGYGTLLVFHLDLCSHGTNLSDCLCTGWKTQRCIISCLYYHEP